MRSVRAMKAGAILIAFALNLFGVYEISLTPATLNDVGQAATGTRRSFFEGLLAVALATPCTAPFLGTAIGFAFTSTPLTILAIFLAIGLGLAAPFALITLVPAWAKWVPRSGSWLLTVRTGLGIGVNKVSALREDRFVFSSCDIGFSFRSRTTIGDDQVAGRTDRQVLGDALDQAEDDRFQQRHDRRLGECSVMACQVLFDGSESD